MPVLTREEYRRRVSERVGESTTDADLSFLEDMNDTYDALSGSETEIARLTAENEDLRRRYRERFEVGDPQPVKEDPAELSAPEPEDEVEKVKTVEELLFD